MFSWQQLGVRRDSTLIAMCVAPGGVSIDWAYMWGNLQKPALWDVMRLSGLPWAEARTQAAHQCLNGNYAYLCFLDTDVLCPPDTIPRLMAHRLPIVSGMYHQRFPTYTGSELAYLPCMFTEGVGPDGQPVKQPITNFQPGQLVEATFVPSGCILIHRSVFEQFIQAGMKRIYQWTLHADNPVGGYSEDFFMTKVARDMFGIRSYVDSSIACIHEAPGRITQKGLEVRL